MNKRDKLQLEILEEKLQDVYCELHKLNKLATAYETKINELKVGDIISEINNIEEDEDE